MKLTIELSVQDALTVLQGLDLTEVVITTLDSVIQTHVNDTVEEPIKPKRKRRTKAEMEAARKAEAEALKEEAVEIAEDNAEELDEKIELSNETLEVPAAFTEVDDTGDSFKAGGTPWAN